MLRRLYDWTMSLAARKSAEYWLAFIAFIESSVFLVPADVLYVPMALARPDRAYRYACGDGRLRAGRHRRMVPRLLCL
jgi:membrane protein YqaA with SNARE-associated domain